MESNICVCRHAPAVVWVLNAFVHLCMCVHASACVMVCARRMFCSRVHLCLCGCAHLCMLGFVIGCVLCVHT